MRDAISEAVAAAREVLAGLAAFSGFAAFSVFGLLGRGARGLRVFFVSPAEEAAREDDGVSSSDLGGRAMEWVSEKKAAHTQTSDAQ